MILTFRYDDSQDWPRAADGQGPPLRLAALDPSTNLNEPNSWRAGGDSSQTFDAWLEIHQAQGADARFQATPYSYLGAYYLGADLAEVAFSISPSTFQFSRRRDTIGVGAMLEESTDLKTWQSLDWAVMETKPHLAPQLERLSLAVPERSQAERYVRLKIFRSN